MGLAVKRQRQVDQPGNEHQAEDHRQAIAQAVDAGCPEFVQAGQSAAERQGQQQCGFDQRIEHGDLAAVDGVIGRFLVCRQRDALGKISRRLVAMGGNEADMPEFQPQAGGEAQGKEGKKEKLEGFGHEGR
eukprot:TRINITY_DN2793_c0_g1_i1.p4 TRINITY_DN2793_c0_g1~~TRINITY_DN2793_c0_g1_i1.p4  ORF type:complete len:131 (-),score=26.34 TRINITY_DN2793_c0_g1_i1:910-1302(-)